MTNKELAERLLDTMKKSGIQIRVMNGVVQYGPAGALRQMEIELLKAFEVEIYELITAQHIDVSRHAS